MDDIKIWESKPSQILNLHIFVQLACLLLVWLFLPEWLSGFVIAKGISVNIVIVIFILIWSLYTLWSLLSVNSTRYELTSERLLIYSGILNQQREEIELYRLNDYKVYSSLFNRIFALGNIQLFTSDRSTPQLVLFSVKDPFKVTDLIRAHVEKIKLEKKILFINT